MIPNDGGEDWHHLDMLYGEYSRLLRESLIYVENGMTSV